MDTNNLNILVEAKKEYTEQLCYMLAPLMIETFTSMYAEAGKMSKNKKILLQYQTLLKEVPNWNNHIVKTHTTKLCDACSWFGDLLAAVFVSNVKILSSVRLTSENKKISLKLPSNEVFVHGCYVSAARDLYKNPFIFQDGESETAIENNLTARFKQSIEETVKGMIPIQQILHTYISQGEKMNEKNIDFQSEEAAEEPEDPDIHDEDEDEEEPEPQAPEPQAPEPQAPEPVSEIKDIKVVGGGGEEDDVLFSGAPESSLKKG